jgi:hypothetical protein
LHYMHVLRAGDMVILVIQLEDTRNDYKIFVWIPSENYMYALINVTFENPEPVIGLQCSVM